jgi:MFS family permease
MSKHTITPVFLGSLISFVGGSVLLMIATALGFVGTAYITSGPDIVAIEPTPMTWMALTMGLVGVVAIVGGALGQFVAWIGALVNTAQLTDKTWFLVLLLLGILSLGFIPMLVYVLAGPEDVAAMPGPAATPAEPTELPKAA